jgi:hypothetical protein
MVKRLLATVLVAFISIIGNHAKAQGVVDVQDVLKVFNQINESGNTTDKYDPSKDVKFPIGIVKNIGSKPYVAAITNSEFYPDHSALDVYFQFFLPGAKEAFAFGSKGVRFNAQGLEMADGVKLQLLKDCKAFDNDKFSITFKANEGTYAQFGCSGVERIHIAGEIAFKSSFITKADGVGVLKTKFELDIVDANNILLAVSLEPFQVTALKGFVFSAQEVTLDMSDSANPKVDFPAGYFANGIEPELWRGFACKQLSVTFPKQLSPSSKNLSISLDNLIIDEDGVSVKAKADNVVGGSESKDQMGWPISVEGAEIDLLRNKLVGAGLMGTIKIPQLDNEPLHYEASLNYDADHNCKYHLFLELPQNKEYNLGLLSAKLKLHENSSIEVTYYNGKLVPKATLNGAMTINQKPIAFGVGFENLILSTEEISVTRLYLTDTVTIAKVAGFQLVINKLDAQNSGDDVNIGISATVGLSTSDEFGIAGTGDITIRAGKNSHHNWGIKKINVNEIQLALNISALQFKGTVRIKQDDPVFGDGFAGEIDCSIAEVLKGIKIGITFGNVNGYSYWYTGGEVSLSIQVGPVTITSFKGAIYYHMKEKEVKFGMLEMANFIPSKEVSIGLKVGVGLGVAEIVKGDVMVKLEFTGSGGVKLFGFDGMVYVLNATEGDQSFQFQANFQMYYDFPKKEFYSNTEVFINVFDQIKGIGPNNRAGYFTILSNPSTWFIKIGTPSDRVGLKAFGMLETGSYFIAGDVHDSFTLPERCKKLIGSYSPPNFAALKSGKCFGFGASLEMHAGGKCGPFYGELALGGGFDLLLNDVSNCSCKGSSGKLGIGGWYSIGQAYFYMDGSIGIRFRSRNREIMSVGLAALLQAELPNPLWIKGTLAGRYRLLGGLVKGKFNFSFEAGTRCNLVEKESELADIKVIGDISPKEGSKDVDVFASPQVAFNATLDKEFKLDEEGKSNKSYKVQLVEYKVTANGNEIAGDRVWNSGGDVLLLNTPDILPQNAEVKVSVRVKWQYKNAQGEWVDSEFNGKPDVEEKTLTFTTGPAPDHITSSNVSYTYPIEGQANFYRDEYNKGYIQMKKRGIDYLFNTTDKGIKWNLIARYSTEEGSTNVPFEYSAANNTVSFMVPAELNLGKVYEVRLLKVPEVIRSNDRNISTQTADTYSSQTDTVSITTKKADGEITIDEEKELYAINFRTSKYSKLADKVKRFDYMYNGAPINNLPYTNLYVSGDIDEGFDEFEVGDTKLITIAAQNDNNLWFNTHIRDAVYGSCHPLTDAAGKGVPPVYSIGLWQQYPATMSSAASTAITLNYNFPEEVYFDYAKQRNWFFEQREKGLPIGTACQPLINLLNRSSYPDIGFNTYGIRFTYRLPGKTEGNSTADTKVKY